VREFYERSYFCREHWQLCKSAVLARDYSLKVRSAGFTPKSGGRYLEIGAGYGHFAADLGRTAAAVDVVEPSEDCRQFIREERFPVKAVWSSLESAKGEYDAVFAFHVLEHLQALGPFLDRVAALLRASGVFMALTPNASSASFRRFNADWGWSSPEQHYLFVSQRTPAGYFRRHGLQLAAARDLQPHAIHYPGWCYSWLTRTGRRFQGPGGSAFLANAADRLARIFLQNSRRSLYVLRAEQLVARSLSPRPYDELLLVLAR
jgi:cyclopropane fatty-acyl-phospholipid synthase-like methyltransferase